MMTKSNQNIASIPPRSEKTVLSGDELRYHSFIANNVDGVWRFDLEKPIPITLPATEQVELLYRYGYFGEANQALADQYGFNTPEDIVGFRLEEFMPRDLPTSVPMLTEAAESNYRINAWESIEQDRHGNSKVFLSNITGEIEQGMLLRIWGTQRDITQQKQLEEETRLRSAMFEQVPEGCVIVEAPSEKFVYMNESFTRITGYAASDVPCMKLSFLQGADTDPETVSRIRETLKQEQAFQGEILNYKKDGAPFWNRMQISPIRNTEGVVTHYIGLLTDITGQKSMEAKLHEQRNELTHLARVAAMGELTAALAHELNQPLTAILSNAQAAKRFLEKAEPDLDEIRAILKDIIADDKRAGEVMNRIRHLIKRNDGRFERVAVNQVVEEVFALISNDLLNKQVNFKTRLAENLPAVYGDQIQLQQVILNLFMNACQAVENLYPHKRRIMVTTKLREDQMVEITVTDSGRGIDEKILEQIFQPFFTTKEDGMGMGLAINRTIIEAHGGHLGAENSPDQGAVFRVTLPIMQ